MDRPPGERTLRFPKDRPVGVLRIMDWEATVLDFLTKKVDSQELGLAQGDVTVPAGKQVHLRFRSAAWEEELVDLSSLDRLRPMDLQGLVIAFNWIPPKEAKRLARHRALRYLNFGPLSKASDGCLPPLAALHSLEYFAVTETEISDQGVKSLRGLTNLKVLDLYGTKITSAGLAHLQGLTELRELRLGLTDVGDEGLKHLAAMKHLETLMLTRTPVTDAGLAHLRVLTDLRMLNLEENTQITDAGLVHLEGLAKLRWLSLGYGPRITDAGLKHLEKLKELEWLELGNTDVTPEARARLRTVLPKLTCTGTDFEQLKDP